VLWRRPGQRAVTTMAPLRLALAPQERRLAVRVLKRRGGEVAQPVLLDVDTSKLPASRMQRPAPRAEPPDPRTSAGREVAARKRDGTQSAFPVTISGTARASIPGFRPAAPSLDETLP
jgi:hypothetical protein